MEEGSLEWVCCPSSAGESLHCSSGDPSEQVGGAVGVGPVSRCVGLWGWDQ